MTRFLVVPQWQGSPSSRAMALVDGAEAIAGDLPRAAVIRVDVPLEAGEGIETGVRRASAILRVQERIRDALLTAADPVIMIGGDCSISIPAIEHVASDDLAVIWLDAHPDLHAPHSTASGAFSGMALSAVMGVGADSLVIQADRAIPAERIVLVGARNIDDAEAELLASSAIRHLPAAEFAVEVLVEAVRATGAKRVYVHVDVDALDPSEINGVTDSAPFGLSRPDVVAALKAIRDEFPIVGATVAGFAPTSPMAAVDDLGAILRIIGAVA